jgi:catechol 2,3-dioxygenase-like lactoylglutathione lyase family enzyme
MTLNHIHLAATDLSATRLFYERYFGFAFEREHGQGVFLRDEKGFLMALDPTSEQIRLPSWFHVGFCQGSEAVVHQLYERMVRDGADIVRALLAEQGEYASYYVADPDGRWVEVSWYAE